MEQQFTLTSYVDNQKRITPVTREVLEKQLGKLKPGDQFRLEAPILVEEKEFFALNCVCRGVNKYDVIFMMIVTKESTTMEGYMTQNRSMEKTLGILTAFVLEDNPPDFHRGGEWNPIRAVASTADEARRMKAKEKLEAEGFGVNKSGKK